MPLDGLEQAGGSSSGGGKVLRRADSAVDIPCLTHGDDARGDARLGARRGRRGFCWRACGGDDETPSAVARTLKAFLLVVLTAAVVVSALLFRAGACVCCTRGHPLGGWCAADG
jgi:hypothetical protein